MLLDRACQNLKLGLKKESHVFYKFLLLYHYRVNYEDIYIRWSHKDRRRLYNSRPKKICLKINGRIFTRLKRIMVNFSHKAENRPPMGRVDLRSRAFNRPYEGLFHLHYIFVLILRKITKKTNIY